MQPNQFYSHECIKNLIGWEEVLDITKSEFALKKISLNDSSTPIENCMTIKRDMNVYSPIVANLANSK